MATSKASRRRHSGTASGDQEVYFRCKLVLGVGAFRKRSGVACNDRSLKVDKNFEAKSRRRSSDDNPYSYLICQPSRDGISSQVPVMEISLWKINNGKSIKKTKAADISSYWWNPLATFKVEMTYVFRSALCIDLHGIDRVKLITIQSNLHMYSIPYMLHLILIYSIIPVKNLSTIHFARSIVIKLYHVHVHRTWYCIYVLRYRWIHCCAVSATGTCALCLYP